MSNLRNGHVRHLGEDKGEQEEGFDRDILGNRYTYKVIWFIHESYKISTHLVIQESIFSDAFLGVALSTCEKHIVSLCLSVLNCEQLRARFALGRGLDKVSLLCKF